MTKRLLMVPALVGTLASTYGQEAKTDDPTNGDEETYTADVDTEEPKANSNAMPHVISHSNNKITAYQGDKIVLQVKATGEELLYRWVRNYNTICTGAKCRFDSAKWGAGGQNITAVIYNKYGSQTINFDFQILLRPPEKKFQEVEPKMMAAEIDDSLSVEDLYVRSLSGIGYSHTNRVDVKVIAQLPRAITWKENLRSHVRGVLQFGRKGKEEHLLLPGGKASLSYDPSQGSGLRRVSLKSGAIRSRQLEFSAPTWALKYSDWLEVNGGARADILLEAGKGDDQKMARLTVLRDFARVKIGDISFVMFPGSSQLLTPQTIGLDTSSPDQKITDRYLRLSTPQYFLKKSDSERGRVSSFLMTDIHALTTRRIEVALASAELTLAEDDGILAIEQLLPIYTKNRNNFSINILLGQSYAQIFALKEANRFYEAAAKLDPKSPTAPFEMGMLYQRNGGWQKALENFETAAKLGYSNSQALNYQIGVAKYNMGHKRDARNHFRYALIKPESPLIDLSAREYLRSIAGYRNFDVAGRLLYGRDSNVFRWGSAERSDGYETTSSLYMRGSLDLAWIIYDCQFGGMKLGFDIDQIYYNAKDAKAIDPLDQKFYFDWLLSIGGARTQDAWVGFQASPFLRLQAIGEERALDTLGLDFRLSVPRITFGPHLIYGTRNSTDPLPGRDDKVEPILSEAVLPSDRSLNERITGIGIDLIRNEVRHFTLSGTSRQVSYKKEAVSIDNFSETKLQISGDTINENYVGVGLDIYYANRTFSKSLDGRKDRFLHAGFSTKYYFTPSFNLGLDMCYESQRSSRETATFGRTNVATGIGLEL